MWNPFGKRCLKPVPLPFATLRTLPTVFDDSFSYYEVLGKYGLTINQMIKYLNNMVIKATYIPSTETLCFIVEADDLLQFSYNANTQSLIVNLDFSGGGECGCPNM